MTREEKNQKILIVDDEPMNRILLRSILKNYATDEAANGREALEKVREINPDLILMDIMMPEMDGIETTKRLKENLATQRIPIVVVSAAQETNIRIQALEAGGNDFIVKPIHPEELLIRVQNLLKIRDFENFVLRHNMLLVEEVEKKTAEVKKAFIDSVQRLTLAAEYKDEMTSSHLKRTSHYTKLMAEYLGYSERARELLYFAAPLHDIGKMGIPDNILTKPGKADARRVRNHQNPYDARRKTAQGFLIRDHAARRENRDQPPRTLRWLRLPKRPEGNRHSD